ncbi:MAG: hypothetical protein LBJ60_00090, partial [Tannerellaceae bacterium]|nr:hypothetical protein [Tannerellaceae bacterium]
MGGIFPLRPEPDTVDVFVEVDEAIQIVLRSAGTYIYSFLRVYTYMGRLYKQLHIPAGITVIP